VRTSSVWGDIVNYRRPGLRVALGIVLLTALIVFGTAGSACALSSISGRVEVWGAPGTPLPDVLVEVFDAEDMWSEPSVRTLLGSTSTDINGDYTVDGLPNDTLVIVAYEDLTGVYRDQVYWFSGVPLEVSNAYYTPIDEMLPGFNVWLRPLADLAANRAYRVSGTDRYGTSAAISASYWGAADTVVIASGAGFADALSAAPLAGAYDAPILLTKPTSLPDVIGDEIERLGATEAYIIGSTSAVSDAVRAQLAARGVTSITRLGGANRYATAEQVIYELPAEYFDGGALPFVCRGDNFADALSASPLSAYYGLPILLTKTTSLPTESARAWQYMVNRGSDLVFVVGSESAVSDDVLLALDSHVPTGLYFSRFFGVNRYATSYALVNAFGPWDIMGLANGANFPDALSGGAALGRFGGALVLTTPTQLDGYAGDSIEESGQYVLDFEAFGGTTAVSSGTLSSAISALGTTFYDIDDPAGHIHVSNTSPLALFLKSAGDLSLADAGPSRDLRPADRNDLRSLATDKWTAE